MSKTISVREAAFRLLKSSSHPMHYREIYKKILPYCNLTGKTPAQSVRSLIAADTRFKRVAEGVYALSEWKSYPIARFAKDIAYDILKKNGKPMNIDNLGDLILNERKFIGSPRMIAKNSISNDDRFYYKREKLEVGLTEW